LQEIKVAGEKTLGEADEMEDRKDEIPEDACSQKMVRENV
jgi:hypothetical protein